MSKEIKISNGTVTLKSFCSRKLKKQINKALYENVEMKGVGKETSIEGFNMEAMDRANDIAMLGMVESINIKDTDTLIKIETFDSMDSNDVNLIIEEINKITNRIVPND